MTLKLRNINQKRAGKKTTFKTEKYRPKEGDKKKGKKKNFSDRPTHVLAPKGQYKKFLF